MGPCSIAFIAIIAEEILASEAVDETNLPDRYHKLHALKSLLIYKMSSNNLDVERKLTVLLNLERELPFVFDVEEVNYSVRAEKIIKIGNLLSNNNILDEHQVEEAAYMLNSAILDLLDGVKYKEFTKEYQIWQRFDLSLIEDDRRGRESHEDSSSETEQASSAAGAPEPSIANRMAKRRLFHFGLSRRSNDRLEEDRTEFRRHRGSLPGNMAPAAEPLATPTKDIPHDERSISATGERAVANKDASASTITTGDSDLPVTSKSSAEPAFHLGRALFKLPRIMWVGVQEQVNFRLTAKDILAAEDLKAIRETMRGRGEIEEDSVDRVGTRMRAVLFGDDDYFTITEISSQCQDIDMAGFTSWDWFVRPEKTGVAELILRLTVLKDSHGNEFENDLNALTKTIKVKVASVWTYPTRFFRDHWQWVVGTIIATGGLIVAYLRLK